MHALNGLALLCACHSSEIALAGSRRLRSTLAAAPVLLAHAVITATKLGVDPFIFTVTASVVPNKRVYRGVP
jgi:hypothetical protein